MKVLRPRIQTYPKPPHPSVFHSWLHQFRFRASSHFPSLQAGVNPDLLPAVGPRALCKPYSLCAQGLYFPRTCSSHHTLPEICQAALTAACKQPVPSHLSLTLLCPHPPQPAPSPAHQGLSRSTYLHGQLLASRDMKKSRSVVVLIQHSDIDGSRGTAGRCSSILHNHQQLVAGLQLPVQAVLGAELPCKGETRTQLSPRISLEKDLSVREPSTTGVGK